jgi:hypothetical protein
MPEPIEVELPPAVPRKGEYVDGNLKQNMLQPGSQCNNNKRQCEEPHTESEQSQRKLHIKAPVDYKHLDDPFSDEEANNKVYYMHAEGIFQATLGADDPVTLKEAKSFKDWPQWEDPICTELNQLKQFGTWKLVECPDDAIPIPNKWVFLKKYNKQGELTKHKVRLVVKGCVQ